MRSRSLLSISIMIIFSVAVASFGFLVQIGKLKCTRFRAENTTKIIFSSNKFIPKTKSYKLYASCNEHKNTIKTRPQRITNSLNFVVPIARTPRIKHNERERKIIVLVFFSMCKKKEWNEGNEEKERSEKNQIKMFVFGVSHIWA